MDKLVDVFEHALKDIYYAENQLVKALSRMEKAASSPDLKEAFRHQQEETTEQIAILDEVFASLGQEPQGVKCDAIEGLIKEVEGVVAEFTGQALDAALIGAAQAVEHYEIARYGTMREWAKQMERNDAFEMLTRILDMEKGANAKLTGLSVEMMGG